MKKRYIITKKIFQILLCFLETMGISVLLTFITNLFIPSNNWFENIERITVFYALYQMIIYIFLQQLNDIRRDEYLAVLGVYKYLEIYNSSKRKDIKKDIYHLINYQLDNGTLNDIDIRNEYIEIKSALENDIKLDDTLIRIKIMKYEHCYEATNLNWKCSILSRIFK